MRRATATGGRLGLRLRPYGLALLWLVGAGAVATPTVPPGSVVRWPGSDLEWCGQAGRRWAPADGACLFPVDLLTPAGALELARGRGGERETRRVRVADYPYPVQHITIEDTSKVDLSAEDLARVREEQALVGALWELDGPRRFTLPLAPPLEPLPAAGRFGARRFFNEQPRSPHSGADYAAPEGTPVRAVADGRVVLAGDLFFSGRSLFVDHGDGLISMYFHLSGRSVGAGDAVARGQVIGRVGATGRATGPHLHFGLRWRSARIDPGPLLGPVGDLPHLD